MANVLERLTAKTEPEDSAKESTSTRSTTNSFATKDFIAKGFAVDKALILAAGRK